VLVDPTGKAVYEAIVEQARRLGADIIALGTHGRRGLARAIMGSDAEGVVRAATVPVMLVRGAERD
jgi:nucleotide-binding universal stress UspA family protein